jgi:hypothetical protein
MSVTLLRTGLWIILISLTFYVIHESYADQPLAEMISADTLQKAGLVGIALVVVGWVLSFFDKVAVKTMKNHCAVCRRAIPKGEIYCREHLRAILDDEHDKTHGPIARKR